MSQDRETRGGMVNSNRRDNRRHDDDDDDDSTQLDRLWGKAKGFASRKKAFMPNARYSTHNDTLELLEREEEEEERSHHAHSFNNNNKYRNGSFSSKGIFDDV